MITTSVPPTEPEAGHETTTPPAAVPPGAGPSGAVPPGAVPPGAVPPGAVPPGAVPPGAVPPGPGAPPSGGWSARARLLRRSRGDRIAAGVAGGLGRYFGVDPVLFRVLFAVGAFFGGAGLIAYLALWVLVPEEGSEHAAIDNWLADLRNRNVPIWVAAAIAGALLWALTLSWWTPSTLWPIAILALVVVILAARGTRSYDAGQSRQATGSPPPTPPDQGPPTTTPPAGPAMTATPAGSPDAAAPASGEPSTDVPAEPATGPDSSASADTTQADSWYGAAAGSGDATTTAAYATQAPQRDAERDARRERRARRLERSRPVLVATLILWLLALSVVGIVDWLHGLSMVTYLWASIAVLGAGFLVGLVARRPTWSLTVLIVAALCGVGLLHGTAASLNNGSGQRHWAPQGVPAAEYALAFGQAELDLSSVTITEPRTLDVDVAAGQLNLLVPESLNVQVEAHVNAGQVVDVGTESAGETTENGLGVNTEVTPRTDSSGPLLTVVVHVGTGEVRISRP